MCHSAFRAGIGLEQDVNFMQGLMLEALSTIFIIPALILTGADISHADSSSTIS